MKKNFKKLGRFGLALTLVLTMVGGNASLKNVLAADKDKVITIIGTSDFHSNVWGYAYEDNLETTDDGMARVYTYIQQVRNENPNTILIDSGDTVQGNILTDDLYNKEDGEHPIISAMNYMQYDAMALGNHEFNFENYDLLEKIVDQADFDMLAGNLLLKETGEPIIDGYKIIEKEGVKIAIIGLTNPNVPKWDGDSVSDMEFLSVADTAETIIEQIGDLADIIVVAAHVGLETEYDPENGSDSGRAIAVNNPEVDILLLGHDHISVNEKEGDTYIAAPEAYGAEVVRIDVTLSSENDIKDVNVQIVSMDGVVPSEELRNIEIVKEAHNRTIDFIQGTILGQTTSRFQPIDEIAGIPSGKIMDTAVVDLINKVQLEATGADVSAAALFKDTSDLLHGDINYGNIFDIYKYDNTVYRVNVTGSELKSYMEWTMEHFNQWVEGDINISFNSEYPSYLYDMFAGVEYEIDLSKASGQRVVNLTFNGEELKDEQELKLAVNNYRYASALKGQNLVSAEFEWESPNSIRDMLVEYFAKNSPVSPTVDNNWSIVGIDLQKENADRQTLVNLINKGQLETPYNKAFNLNSDEVKEILAATNNIKIGDKFDTIDVFVSSEGNTYYRLRDIAMATSGTDKSFDIGWDGQIVIKHGENYKEDALLLHLEGYVEWHELTVNANGENVTVFGAYAVEMGKDNGHYYFDEENLENILGVEIELIDGVLEIK